MRKILTIMAIVVCTCVSSTGSLWSQVGARLYFRFNSYTDPLRVNSQGVRVKQDPTRSFYWVLGNTADGDLGNACLGIVYPGSTIHTHTHFYTSSSYPILANASDFDNNSAGEITCGNLLYSMTNNGPVADMMLFGVKQTGASPGSIVPGGTPKTAFHYNLPNREAVGETMLKADNVNNVFAVAWNDHLDNPGPNVMDWSIAKIAQGTGVPVWSHTWGGTDAQQVETIHDLIIDNNGHYAVCGQRIDQPPNVHGGLITRVNSATGALMWQRQYNLTGYDVDFQCISEDDNISFPEYVVTGSAVPHWPNTGANRVLVMGINASTGAVVWERVIGTTAYDFTGARHCQMSDHGIVVVGSFVEYSGGYQGGLALKFMNPDHLSAFPQCLALCPWLNLYRSNIGANDPLPLSFRDVCPKIHGDLQNEVCIVGTGVAYHENFPINDVLFVETEDGTYKADSYSVATNNWHLDQGCVSWHPDAECDSIEVVAPVLQPEVIESVTKIPIDYTYQDDGPYRYCNASGDDFDSDARAPKRASEDTPDHTAQNDTQLSLYPNPAVDIVNFSYVADENGRLSIELFDVSGSSVAHLSYIVSKGYNALRLNTGFLATGMYQVVFKLGSVQNKQSMLVYH